MLDCNPTRSLASLVVAQSWDQKKNNLESVTETHMIYWTGHVICQTQRSWSDTPLCAVANGRQKPGTNLHYQRRKGTTTYRGNWHLIGSPVTNGTSGWGRGKAGSYWVNPIIKRTIRSCGWSWICLSRGCTESQRTVIVSGLSVCVSVYLSILRSDDTAVAVNKL